MGIGLRLQYCIIARVSDYRSEISLQDYTVYFVASCTITLLSEKELARIALVG